MYPQTWQQSHYLILHQDKFDQKNLKPSHKYHQPVLFAPWSLDVYVRQRNTFISHTEAAMAWLGEKKMPRKQFSCKTDLNQNSYSWSRQNPLVLYMCALQLLATFNMSFDGKAFRLISKADLELRQQPKLNDNKSVICRLNNKIWYIWPLGGSFSILTSSPIHSSFQYSEELTYFTLT